MGRLIHYIGEQYQGGIVYWVETDGQHGLIAAKADQGHAQWYNGIFFNTHATDDSIYAGAKNTQEIIASQTSVEFVCAATAVPDTCTAGADNATGNYAALLAANYKIQADGVSTCTGSASEICYGDWYLPSKEELNFLYAQKDVVGGFAYFYWSSSEYISYEEWVQSHGAWVQDFSDGVQFDYNKNSTLPVRAVRAF